MERKVKCKRCKTTRTTNSDMGIITCTNCGRKIRIEEELVK